MKKRRPGSAKSKARGAASARLSGNAPKDKATVLIRERDEALHQQAATAEILKVISSSPADTQPVFEAIVQSGLKLFPDAAILIALPDGDTLRAAAFAETNPARAKALLRRWPVPLTREYMHAVAILDRKMVDIPDGREAPSELASGARYFLTTGYRAITIMPLMRGREAIGALSVVRVAPGPLSKRQIALLRTFAAQAVIAIENTRLLNELRERTDDLSESLEQQTATSEVLKVISSSSGELEPVFKAMLENAVRICGAHFGNLALYDGSTMRMAALHNAPRAFEELRRSDPVVPLDRSVLGIIVQTKKVAQISDMTAEEPYASWALVKLAGARAVLAVPMLREGELVGAIVIYRTEPTAFSEKQIELLTNFAAQAVIAIENARLLSELRESLQQQTATADVLKVISSSPGELEPVFNAMLANATRLCGAQFGTLNLYDGELFHIAAVHNVPSAFAEARLHAEIRPHPSGGHARVLLTKDVVQIEDIRSGQAYLDGDPAVVAVSDLGGARTIVLVPMLKDGALVGTIAIYRQEVLPFTDKQIDLVRNFGAQAVIAIENARLLSELRESLEQQTATSEVLKVISSSPGTLGPVFDAMLENAIRICEAKFGNLFLREGEYEFRAVAVHGESGYADWSRKEPLINLRERPRTPLDRVRNTGTVLHIHDLRLDESYGTDSRVTALVDTAGARSVITVPMLKDKELIGTLVIYRTEVRPFSDKQIELLNSFAAQAVIAIENTRLLSELRESLQQQTATADVLKVISSSPGNLEPVFQAILASATEICQTKFGTLNLYEDGVYRSVALHNPPPQFRMRLGQKLDPHPDGGLARVARTKQVVHIEDIRTERPYLEGNQAIHELADLGGARTQLIVPMLKENELLGSMSIYRQEVRPFTDKQIELVKNFAAQGVIAIENTRLLSELRESLQQQTATADVLKVISSSTGELQPVFEAILENAVRICEAGFGNLWLHDGKDFQAAAIHGAPPEYRDLLQHEIKVRPGAGTPIAAVIETKRPSQIADLAESESYRRGDPVVVASVKIAGTRSLAAVPLLKDGELVGAIAIYRQEVRPFTDKQIDLVQNFAAQAVIAIENTRLLNELRESLQQQTATADVLKVISSSPGELEPVFQAMLGKAVQLCEAKFGIMFRFADGVFRAVSWLGDPPLHILEQPHVVSENPHNLLTRIVTTKQPAHSSDLTREPAYIEGNPRYRALVDTVGARSLLVVPMLKNTDLIGAIVIYWQEARSFTEKEMELISNFAAQAVIAIDNARLLSELRESLQQQTATADVLKVISRSTFDLGTVLQTLVESVARLCDADRSVITRERNGTFYRSETYGFSQEWKEYVKDIPIKPERGSAFGRALLEGRAVQIADASADPEYTLHEVQRLGDYRTILAVPMVREGNPIGVVSLVRKDVRPFTDKQIELASTFADQAAIAIENVRLFENVEARTRDLAASLEDLRNTQDRLVQTQKLASLGQLTAGIAHEIKNPLNFVNNFSTVSSELIDELQDTLKGLTVDDKRRKEISELTGMLRGNLDKVVEHGKRADSIVKNMLLHSREGSGEHRLVDINALVEESLNLAYHGKRAETQGFNVTLERSLDPAAGEADVFPQDITRVLLNLISNGFYAASKRKAQTGDGFEPVLAAATKSLGDRVEIRIRDNGTGIPSDVREKIFNPFFTTKPAGEGTGLGLSISHDIVVKQHAGSIEVDTEPGAFTEIRVILPRKGAFPG